MRTGTEQIVFLAEDEEGREEVYKTGIFPDYELVNRLLEAEPEIEFVREIPTQNSPLLNFSADLDTAPRAHLRRQRPALPLDAQAHGRAGRHALHELRQVGREDIRRDGDGQDLRRRRWPGRGQGGAQGDSGLPARAGQVRRDRREAPQGRAARRPSGHGQDPARARRRGRGARALLLHKRQRVRGDVRRHGRGEGARPLQAGEREGALHRLHRRDRHDRQEARLGRHTAATTSASRRSTSSWPRWTASTRQRAS